MERVENYKIKTIVVEDEEKILSHICKKITSLDDSFEIIETARNGQEAIEKIEALRPNVVFTDVSMPVMNGMELIQLIRRQSPKTTVVIISGSSNFSYAQQAIRYGVFNYLLKPLEDSALVETLFDLKKNFLSYLHKKQRHMIYSSNYQLLSSEKVEFLIAEVCIGNQIYSIQDEDVNRMYADEMEKISWEPLMEKLYKDQEWFVADDHAVNQKIVGVKRNDAFSYSASALAEDLRNAIGELTGQKVSVCTVNQYIDREELWDYAKRLRNVMKKQLVIGKSSKFSLEELENKEDNLTEIIKVKLNMYITNYLNSLDFYQLIDEIKIVFNYMKKYHVPQDNIEKICVYILTLLEISDQNYQHEVLEEIQNQMIKTISLSKSEDQLYDELIQIICQINGDMETISEEDQFKRLLDYVDGHFAGISSMEMVAEAFGYSYAYLSRIFKKQVGESMSRYVTKKKIELAKDMLENRLELKVTEVSDLCGYNDYRYFCRVFKSEAGISPGDYRKKYVEK